MRAAGDPPVDSDRRGWNRERADVHKVERFTDGRGGDADTDGRGDIDSEYGVVGWPAWQREQGHDISILCCFARFKMFEFLPRTRDVFSAMATQNIMKEDFTTFAALSEMYRLGWGRISYLRLAFVIVGLFLYLGPHWSRLPKSGETIPRST